MVRMEHACDFCKVVNIANTFNHIVAIDYGENWVLVWKSPQQDGECLVRFTSFART
jgi:hypothetical protein